MRVIKEFLDYFEDNEFKGKTFNTTGLCIADKHYMVNIDYKLKSIVKLVQRESYFAINRPRQYGKTTTIHTLEEILNSRYKVISLDFEGLGSVFHSEENFCNYFVNAINSSIGLKLETVYTLILIKIKSILIKNIL